MIFREEPWFTYWRKNIHSNKMHLKHPSRTSVVYHTLNPKHEKYKRGKKKNIKRRDLKKIIIQANKTTGITSKL